MPSKGTDRADVGSHVPATSSRAAERRSRGEHGAYHPDVEGGYIRVFREELFYEHHLHPWTRGEKANRGYAWIDLRGSAEWRTDQVLRKGQLLASDKYLATRWNWSKARVRNFLIELQEKGLIQRKPQGGRQPSIITILRYDIYNGPMPPSDEHGMAATDHQEEKGEQREQRIEDKNTNQRFDPDGSALVGCNDNSACHATCAPVTHDTFAGLFKKLSGGEVPDDGMGNEIYRMREMELEPLEGCAVLVAQWWLDATGEFPHYSFGIGLNELIYSRELINLGLSLVGSAQSAPEIYDAVEEMMSDPTAVYGVAYDRLAALREAIAADLTAVR